MGWTKRAEIKDNFQDIVEYLKSMDNFHDYRIGTVRYDGGSADITVEEVIPGSANKYNAGLVWDFHFEKITAFYFDVDCVMRFPILEVEPGDAPGEISFSLDSGNISITAEEIKLGIPTSE